MLPFSSSSDYASSLGLPLPPRIEMPDGTVVDGPRREWIAHVIRWRWLLDSWEGGEAYRNATYGSDSRGLPIRNLIRHKREYPDPSSLSPSVVRPTGTDPYSQAEDDDYQLRLARTPIPTFTEEVAGKHTASVYEQEIQRTDRNPQKLRDWWKDVDGCGTTVDEWMADTIAPLLLVLGQLDVMIEQPAIPPGIQIRSLADEQALGLDSAVASYILPENIPWWRMDKRGNYTEVLVRECESEVVRWRYWTPEGWCLYDDRGRPIPSGQTSVPDRYRDRSGRYSTAKAQLTPHGYGCVPIVRIYDRKRPRCREVGLPRYEAIAELQREYYNRDSELILSDTTQAHPLLQGPEDFVQADGTIPIGPSWLLPKKKNTQGGAASYEPFEVIEFPKGGADSLRSNKADLRDAADRAACLTKPAGAAGTNGSTVAQSGLSKRLDQCDGDTLLSQIAGMLQRGEVAVAKLALRVMGVEATPDAIEVLYPREFDLFDSVELADSWARFQVLLDKAGALPKTELAIGRKLIRLLLPGATDDVLEQYDEELEAHLASRRIQLQQDAALKQQMAEALNADAANSDLQQVSAMPTKTAQVATGSPPPRPDRPDEK